MNNFFLKRTGILEDLKEIYGLEKLIFKNEAWTLKMLEDELSNDNIFGILIIQENGLVLGYCMFQIYESEYHILNFGVFPFRQNEGIGNTLFTGFLKNLSKIPSVFLEVKKSNFPAIKLYKKYGFKASGIRNNYYKNGS